MENGRGLTERLPDVVATPVAVLAAGDANVPLPRPRHSVAAAATILNVC